jgi:hypothetical protein
MIRPFRCHWLGALAVFAVLAIVHTWPLARDPGVLSRNDNGDAQLNEWIVAWVAHQLPRNPARLFEGNIFYPAHDTLAFSEPLIVPALMAAPALWLGASPVLAMNLLILGGFALTAFLTYAVIFSWTRDRFAALVAGSLFAFNTHTLTRLPHVQALHTYGLPLALLLTDRLILEPRLKLAAALAVCMASLAYTSGYLMVFATVMIAVVLMVRAADWWRQWRHVIGAFAAAAIITAIVVLPLAIPYRRVATEQGMVRPLSEVAFYSATPTGYLAAAGRVHFATWSARFFANPVDAFFPGVVAILLAAVAIWSATTGRAHPAYLRARTLMLCAIAAAGFALSLGPATPIYGWLFAAFPPMQGLRAAARFGNLFLLGMALLAGLGLAWLRGHVRPRAAAVLGVVALALVNVEALRAPFEYRRFEGIPNIYRLLAQEPGPVVLAETPFYPPHAVFENAEYVLNSTAHWRPLMNGYSGYIPQTYHRVAWTFWYFPNDAAIRAMREAGVTHVTVHPRRFGNEAATTIELLSNRPDFELLGISAGTGIRLYRLR